MLFKIRDTETLVSRFNKKMVDIDELLIFCTEHRCSDLYVTRGEQPYINRYGKIVRIPCLPINAPIWNKWASVAISSERNAEYVRNKMLDFAYIIPEKQFRYRVSVGFEQGRNKSTFRMITPEIPSFKHIAFDPNMVEVLEKAFSSVSGIVLCVGATGSGKTTTLASCINDFTKPGRVLDSKLIITLEDPCEYVYLSTQTCKISQKELGVDFRNFALGVKQALREHPNMIVCGEIRDREVVKTCIDASRTGHIVASTLHSDSVDGAVARIAHYLEGGEDLMFDLVMNLKLIIAQRISADGTSFSLKTQYVYFDDKAISILLDAIEKKLSLRSTIRSFFKNKELKVKDW